MRNETDFNKALDQAVEAVRTAQPDRATTSAAASRVWQRISSELAESEPADSGRSIAGCADVQALLPSYRAGKLSQAREWLVQDHLRECVNCRNAAKGARGGVVLPWREPVKAEKSTMPVARRFAWAAALFVTLGTGAYMMRDRFLPSPGGERARLEWSDGPVYIVNAGVQRTLGQQGVINERDWVRTPSGTHAMLRLRDGSQVELNERSELSVAVNRSDTTLNLERGTVLVQAAKRRSGHLLVTSNDATVSVTGTVFAVDRGVKGTRVSVVEGEVLVDQRGRTDTLHAGDQIATNHLLEPVAIKDEIGWSKNRDEHLKLLNELSEITKRLKTIELPGLRYSSRLIDALPANTVVYVSLPNLGDTLARAESIVEERIGQSAELRAWYEKNGGAATGPGLKDVVELFRGASDYIGDEVVLALIQDPGQPAQFAAVAEVRRPGLREFVDASLTKLSVNERPKMLVTDKLAVLSPEAKTLDAFAAPGLAAQPFGQKIRDTFKDGANILFCADLSRVKGNGAQPPVSQKLGVDDVHYLVLAERDFNGHSETRGDFELRRPAARTRFLARRPRAHGLARLRVAERHGGRLLRDEDADAAGGRPDRAGRIVQPAVPAEPAGGRGESRREPARGPGSESWQRRDGGGGRTDPAGAGMEGGGGSPRPGTIAAGARPGDRGGESRGGGQEPAAAQERDLGGQQPDYLHADARRARTSRCSTSIPTVTW